MQFLDKLTPGFVFGVGGLGDLILLLSTFIDDPDADGTNIVFWANDATLIKGFLDSFPPFVKKLGHKIIFQGWQTKEQFEAIVNHPNFRGKAHIPDRLEFVKEWSQNAAQYRALIPEPGKCEAIRRLHYKLYIDGGLIGLGLWGSQGEAWKKRRVTDIEFNAIMKKVRLTHPEATIAIFGSQSDKQEFPLPKQFTEEKIMSERGKPYDGVIDLRGSRWLEVFGYLGLCKLFISTDTWYKTYTGLYGIPTTVIKSQYTVPISDVFKGLDYDPSDNIFLNDWGFNIIELEELLNAKDLFDSQLIGSS